MHARRITEIAIQSACHIAALVLANRAALTACLHSQCGINDPCVTRIEAPLEIGDFRRNFGGRRK